MGELIKCPFCGEEDFDLVGLKNHFERGWCDTYNETIDLPHDPLKEMDKPHEPDLIDFRTGKLRSEQPKGE